MAMRFEKVGPGFNGFDSRARYQMVPVRDRRDLMVVTEGSACELNVQNTRVASLANFVLNGVTQTSVSTLTSVAIPPRSRLQFSIMGKLVGMTMLTLDDEAGSPQQTWMVSVKELAKATYSLLFLEDRKRATTRPQAEAVSFMQGTEATFLKQANLQLTRTGDLATVKVARDLGNPLDIDIALRPVIDATPSSFFTPKNIRVYCCWDVTDKTNPHAAHIIGITSGQTCFVEDGSTRFVFAHEVGHALGLVHTGTIEHLMFPEQQFSSLLQQFEIDTINPTGLDPA